MDIKTVVFIILTLFFINYVSAQDIIINPLKQTHTSIEEDKKEQAYYDAVKKEAQNANKSLQCNSLDMVKYVRNIVPKARAKWHPVEKYNEDYSIVAVAKLDRDGNVLDVKITKPAPYEIENENVIKAVKEAAPYEKFPDTCKRDFLPIEFSFKYRVLSANENSSF